MDRAVIFTYDDARRRVHAAGAHGVALDGFTGGHVTVESAPVARQALTEDRVIEVLAEHGHDISDDFASSSATTRSSTSRSSPRDAGSASSWPSRRAGTSPIDEPRRELLRMLGKTLALASASRSATYHGERARELEERIDFARDIHDGVVQRLFGVSLALSSEQPLTEQARGRCAARGARRARRAALGAAAPARPHVAADRHARWPRSSTASAPSTPTSASASRAPSRACPPRSSRWRRRC